MSCFVMIRLVSALVCASLFAGLTSTCSAQSNAQQHRRIIRNLIEEKFRIDADSLHVFLNDPDGYRARHAMTDGENDNGADNTIQDFVNTKISTTNNNEAEIHAAINPTDPNNIVCAPISLVAQLRCPVYYTHDGGTTWKRSTFQSTQHASKGTLYGGGDPCFAFDHTGALYFTWIMVYQPTSGSKDQNMEIYWAKSTDGGATFQRDETKDGVLLGKIVNQNLGDSNSVGADKEWIMCDRSNSPYRGNFYAAMVHVIRNQWLIRLRKKPFASDRFDSLSTTPLIDSILYAQDCSLDVDTLGRVHMCLCAALKGDSVNKGKWYWHIKDAVSMDGGQSFESVNAISTAFILPYDSTTDLYLDKPVGASSADASPQIVCDKSGSSTRPATNNMYCVWSGTGIDSMTTRRLDTYFSRSVDGGVTWSRPIILNDDPPQIASTQVYSTIAVNEDGIIAVCWYDRRADTSDKKGYYYMTLSFDNGKTFSKNIQVSNQLSDFSKGQNFDRVTGEYNQVVMTKTHAIAFWGDVRSNVTQVYMAKVPLDSTASSVENIRSLDNDWSIISVAPQPMKRSCRLHTTSLISHDLKAQLFDENGTAIADLPTVHIEQGQSSTELSLPIVPSGAYFLRLSDSDQMNIVRLIVR